MTPVGLLTAALLAAAPPPQSISDLFGGGGLVGFLVPMAVIFAIFYFFIVRPQRKREQEHEEMVENLEKGDQIVTIGGIHGTIRRIDDDSVLVQVDSNSTKLRIDKQAIANVGPDDD
jgi:preprotein translocase subunit YajC